MQAEADAAARSASRQAMALEDDSREVDSLRAMLTDANVKLGEAEQETERSRASLDAARRELDETILSQRRAREEKRELGRTHNVELARLQAEMDVAMRSASRQAADAEDAEQRFASRVAALERELDEVSAAPSNSFVVESADLRRQLERRTTDVERLEDELSRARREGAAAKDSAVTLSRELAAASAAFKEPVAPKGDEGSEALREEKAVTRELKERVSILELELRLLNEFKAAVAAGGGGVGGDPRIDELVAQSREREGSLEAKIGQLEADALGKDGAIAALEDRLGATLHALSLASTDAELAKANAGRVPADGQSSDIVVALAQAEEALRSEQGVSVRSVPYPFLSRICVHTDTFCLFSHFFWYVWNSPQAAGAEQ